jgi:flagellar M-ring protein FliF
VSVVDQKGETLSALGGSPSGSVSEQATDYETRTRTQIQAMLDRLLGPGNSTVTVAADISASSGQTTSKTYSTPTQAPVLSESSDTSSYKGSGSGAAAGVLGTDTTSAAGNGSAGTYTSKKGVKNNAVNETTTTQTITPGSLTRQTIAVAVNASAAANIPTSTIQNLVGAAAGVNAQRGDTVTVAAASFSNAAALSAKAALAQAQSAQSADNMSRILTAAVWVVGGLVSFVVLVLLLRKLFRKPEPEAIDGGELNVFPVSPSGVPVITGTIPSVRLDGPAHPATTPMPKSFPPPVWAEDSSPFAQLQADVDALAGADPERTAEYLRALMSDRATT